MVAERLASHHIQVTTFYDYDDVGVSPMVRL